MDEKEFVGVQDDMGEDIAEKQLASLKEQVDMFEKSIERIKEQRRDYEEQCAIDERVWQIRLRDDNHMKLPDKLQFKYELDPEFWECVKKKQAYEYRDHKARMESTIKGFERNTADLESEKSAALEKIAALTEE